MASATTTNVEIDSRGRATSLGRVAEAGSYRATRLSNGRVLLEPTYTEAELLYRRNPEASAQLDRALSDLDAFVVDEES